MALPSTAFITDPGELMVAAMLLVGLIPLLRLWRRKHRATWFLITYLFLFLMSVATIAEAYTMPVVFNYAEHVSALLAAGFLVYYLHHTRREVKEYGG